MSIGYLTEIRYPKQTEEILKDNRREGYDLSVGIEDPMTEKPGIRLAMECAYQNGRNILWQKEK